MTEPDALPTEEEAPVSTPVPVKYAGFGVRTWASLFDSIVIAIALLPVGYVMQMILFAGVDQQAIQAEMQARGMTRISEMIAFSVEHGLLQRVMASNLIQMVVVAVLVVWLWIRYAATPGKKFMKLRIIDARTGGEPTTRQYIIRYLGYFVSMMPLMLGFLWIAFDKRKQGFHDKLAGTVVLDERKPVRFFQKKTL